MSTHRTKKRNARKPAEKPQLVEVPADDEFDPWECLTPQVKGKGSRSTSTPRITGSINKYPSRNHKHPQHRITFNAAARKELGIEDWKYVAIRGEADGSMLALRHAKDERGSYTLSGKHGSATIAWCPNAPDKPRTVDDGAYHYYWRGPTLVLELEQ